MKIMAVYSRGELLYSLPALICITLLTLMGELIYICVLPRNIFCHFHYRHCEFLFKMEKSFSFFVFFFPNPTQSLQSKFIPVVIFAFFKWFLMRWELDASTREPVSGSLISGFEFLIEHISTGDLSAGS